MGVGKRPVVSLDKDHSFGCLDLALPKVTCQSIAASSAVVMASTGQGVHRVCASWWKRRFCPSWRRLCPRVTSGRERAWLFRLRWEPLWFREHLPAKEKGLASTAGVLKFPKGWGQEDELGYGRGWP